MTQVRLEARHGTSRQSPRRLVSRPLSVLIGGVALLWMAACATSGTGGQYSSLQDGETPSTRSEDGGGFGFWKETDDFQLLQQSAGLGEDSRHPEGTDLEPRDARSLWEALAGTRATLQNFAPRRSLLFLLRQVLSQSQNVPYAGLLERLRLFHRLVVMRPDGYLAIAVTGEPLQRMGRVELREGKLMAGRFEVGAFYKDRGGVFYALDDSLQKPGALAGEQRVGLDVHDPKFGAWWERSSHLKKAAGYTRRWAEFLDNNPTYTQILEYGRKLGSEFGFQVNF